MSKKADKWTPDLGGEVPPAGQRKWISTYKIALEGWRRGLELTFYGVVEKENKLEVKYSLSNDEVTHHFSLSMEEETINFAKDIIDYYFPKTVNNERPNLYFNFDKIVDSLTSRAAEIIKVSNCPTGKVYGKKYIVSGRVQKVSYRKWITRKAREHGLHGYTRNLNNGDVEVLVASTNQDVVSAFKDICLKGPRKADVQNIKEQEFTKPVEIGFKILTTKKKDKIVLHEYEKQLHKLQSDKKTLQNKVQKLEKKYDRIVHSKNWKLTYPIRYVSAFIQNKEKPKKY